MSDLSDDSARTDSSDDERSGGRGGHSSDSDSSSDGEQTNRSAVGGVSARRAPRPLRSGTMVKLLHDGKFVWRARVTVRPPPGTPLPAAAASGHLTPLKAAAAAQQAAAAAAAAATASSQRGAHAATPLKSVAAHTHAASAAVGAASSSKAAAVPAASGSKRKEPPREIEAGGKKLKFIVGSLSASSAAAAAGAPSAGSKKKSASAMDTEQAPPPLSGDYKHQGPTSRVRMPAHPIGAAVIPGLIPPPLGSFTNISQGLPAMQSCLSPFPFTRRVAAPPAIAAAAAASADVHSSSASLIVPSSASWFDLNQVHEIERASLPEFFDNPNSRSKNRYKDTRNYIVNTYRKQPRAYLSLTEVLRQVAGDHYSLQRIFAFLEARGLINFHVDPGSQPISTSMGNPNSSYPLLVQSAYAALTPARRDAAAAAAALVPGSHDDVLQQLIDYNAPSSSASLSLRRSVLLGPATAQTLEPLVAEYAARRDPAAAGLSCSVCGSASVETVRYVVRQKRDYVCCSECFLQGRYPALVASGDFERVLADEEACGAISAPAGTGEWSREEQFRLLQALAMHEDDWESVAEHVKTRSKDECALKFVQMPIEEPFLEQLYNVLQPAPGQPSALSDGISGAGGASQSGAPSLSSVPFGDAPNPILSQVTFLSTFISPAVGAAAAQAALTYVSVREMDGMPVTTPFGPGRIVVPATTGSASMGAASAAAAATASSFAHSSFTRPDGILAIDLGWGRLFAHASQVSVDKEAQKVAEALKAKTKQEPVWVKHLVPMSHHCLQAAARKSVELAEEEERKVLRYVAQITGTLMKRVELKLAHLDELDTWVGVQKAAFDAGATQYVTDRAAALAAAASLPPLNPPPPPPGPPPPNNHHHGAPAPGPGPNLGGHKPLPLPLTHAHLQPHMQQQQQQQQQQHSHAPYHPQVF